MTDRRLGRRPPKLAPALKLALTTTVPPHPVYIDHLTRTGLRFGLYANDTFGDCGPTSVANLVRLTSSWLTGSVVEPTLDEVFTLYRQSGNPDFDPDTDSDDNGVDMQTMLESLVKHGIGGYKPLAFAKVDARNLDEVRAAIAIFGAVLFGVTLQDSQQKQSDHAYWDYSPSGEWGGHAVLAGSYTDPSGFTADKLGVISWAEHIDATDSFLTHQLEEVWVVIWPQHLSDKTFLDGVDMSAMAADYRALTGKEFPVDVSPDPTPAPTPEPVTFPAALVAAAQALASDPTVTRFLTTHHVGYLVPVAKRVQAVVAAVVTTKTE